MTTMQMPWGRFVRGPSVRWVLGAAGLVGLAALGGTVQTVGSAAAGFDGKGPAGFSLHGETSELVLADRGEQLRVEVPLGRLTTGISLRDKHMREKYLEVARFPSAVLELPWSALTLPPEGHTQSGTAVGQLTVHGQTHPATLHYELQRTGATYAVRASLPLNLKDYGIVPPSYLGLTVKPDLQVFAHFQAHRG